LTRPGSIKEPGANWVGGFGKTRMYSNGEREFENVASNNPFALASQDCCATN